MMKMAGCNIARSLGGDWVSAVDPIEVNETTLKELQTIETHPLPFHMHGSNLLRLRFTGLDS
jgi:hypothetical protein